MRAVARYRKQKIVHPPSGYGRIRGHGNLTDYMLRREWGVRVGFANEHY